MTDKQRLTEFLTPILKYPSIKWELIPNDERAYEVVIKSDLEGYQRKHHEVLQVTDNEVIELLKGEEFYATDPVDFAMSLFISRFYI